MMARFLKAPIERALWYSGFGVPLYVSGMIGAAVAVRSLPSQGADRARPVVQRLRRAAVRVGHDWRGGGGAQPALIGTAG